MEQFVRFKRQQIAINASCIAVESECSPGTSCVKRAHKNTGKWLNRPCKVAITNNSGLAGIAYWEKEGEQLDRSNLLPFYGWKRDDYLHTLPYGKDKTSTYFMTPLVGRYLDKKGGWVLPLWQHKETEKRKETNLLLGIGRSMWILQIQHYL